MQRTQFHLQHLYFKLIPPNPYMVLKANQSAVGTVPRPRGDKTRDDITVCEAAEIRVTRSNILLPALCAFLKIPSPLNNSSLIHHDVSLVSVVVVAEPSLVGGVSPVGQCDAHFACRLAERRQ
jgi:hypothetical protein